MILPYVEQGPLWEQTRLAFAHDVNPFNDPPHVGLATVIKVYECPADSRLGSPLVGPDGRRGAYSSYLGVRGGFGSHKDGMFPGIPGINFHEVTDGLSNTLMVGERPPSASLDSGWWYTRHPDGDAVDRGLYAEGAVEEPCVPPAMPDPDWGFSHRFVFGPGRLTNECDKYHFWSLHPSGANFAMGDGSVRFISYTSWRILRPLATRNGGEIVSLSD
jgi:prepilin-type processing-associated H-X9-DG protein